MLRAVAFAKEVSRVLYTENNGTKVRRNGVGWDGVGWGGGDCSADRDPNKQRGGFLGTKNCCNYCNNLIFRRLSRAPKE